MAKELTMELDLDLREPLVCSVSTYAGRVRFDVRHNYISRDGGIGGPTKKGINIPLDNALEMLHQLVEAYNEATGSHLIITENKEG